jgi:hypothetical protein
MKTQPWHRFLKSLTLSAMLSTSGLEGRIRKNIHNISLVVFICCLAVIQVGFILGFGYVYTLKQLMTARETAGVYQTPVDAARTLMAGDGMKAADWEIQVSEPACFLVCSERIMIVHVVRYGVSESLIFLQTNEGWVPMSNRSKAALLRFGMMLYGLAP